MQEKIKVAFIYKPSWVFLSGSHFDNTTYYFFMYALKRNSQLDVTYFPAENYFDCSKLKSKYDIILLPNNNTDGSPDKLIGINDLSIPVICRTGDPHWAKKYNQLSFHEKWKIDYYFNFMHESYFYKFYPRNFKYKTIVFGIEPSLYQKIVPFKDRIKNKILNSGAVGSSDLKSRIVNRILNPKRSGWYFYKLRTKCNDLPYIDYYGMKDGKYIQDDYPSLLSKYRAAIAATTLYPTIKYWETSAAGCLTFMEITEKNNGKYLGYIDYETSIFISESNYKKKFQEYLSEPDNPKWEKIAENGREYALREFNNDKAVKTLVELMQNLL